MDYKYQSPIEKGYLKVKLSRAEHNAIFRYRQWSIIRKTDIYYNGHDYIAEHFTHLWFVCLISFPALIIGTFINGIPDTWHDLMRALRQRHYGAFSSDSGPVPLSGYQPEFKPVVDAWLSFQAKNTNN